MILSHIPFDLDLLPEKKGVYFVGGTTRDLLLGRTPVDYDITVSQNPEIFAETTATRSRGRLVRMGRRGKRSYRVITGKIHLDITGINGPTIRHDLERRDVTVNALAIEVDSGNILDWVDGRRDLLEKRIRMVSENSFRDDPVRLLRVFRLAASLDFSIEAATISAVSPNARLIRHSAGERIRAELYQLLSSRNSAPHVAMMVETGLLSALFPEAEPDIPKGPAQRGPLPAYSHIENVLNRPPPEFPPVDTSNELPAFGDRAAWQKFAMLLTPGAGILARRGETDEPAVSVCRRLRLSIKERKFVTGIVRHHPRLFDLHGAYRQKSLTPREVARFFMAVESLAPHLLLHLLATAQSTSSHTEKNPTSVSQFVRHMLQAYRNTYLPLKALPPVVTGRDLQTIFGLPPSPRIGKILTRLEEGRLSGEIPDRESALEMAREMITPRATS